MAADTWGWPMLVDDVLRVHLYPLIRELGRTRVLAMRLTHRAAYWALGPSLDDDDNERYPVSFCGRLLRAGEDALAARILGSLTLAEHVYACIDTNATACLRALGADGFCWHASHLLHAVAFECWDAMHVLLALRAPWCQDAVETLVANLPASDARPWLMRACRDGAPWPRMSAEVARYEREADDAYDDVYSGDPVSMDDRALERARLLEDCGERHWNRLAAWVEDHP